MFDLSTLSPRERRLLRSAQNTADQGKYSAAEMLYRSFVAEFPDSIPGLIGLARVVRSAEERDQHLHRVLELAPENEIAQAALDGASLETLLAPKKPQPEPEPEPIAKPEPIQEKAPPAVPQAAAVPTPIAVEDMHEPELDAAGGLRCNRCGKPIDQHNSKYTAVGYRCNDCIREIEDGMYSAGISTYIIAFLIGLTLSTIVAFLIGRFLGYSGFFGYIITFFISSALGTTIGSLAFRAGGRNRGRYLSVVMSASVWLGALLALGILFIIGFPPPVLVLGIFGFGASSTAYFRVR